MLSQANHLQSDPLPIGVLERACGAISVVVGKEKNRGEVAPHAPYGRLSLSPVSIGGVVRPIAAPDVPGAALVANGPQLDEDEGHLSRSITNLVDWQAGCTS